MATTEVKVRTYRIRAVGGRNYSVTLPPVWVQDMGLQRGDLLEVYRDTSSRLIIVAPKRESKP